MAVVADGDSNHATGLLLACRSLTIFTAAADAAGPNLNNATFAAALDEIGEIGEIALPGTGTSTLGAGKYDAEDDVGLSVYSPDAADSEPDFVEFTG